MIHSTQVHSRDLKAPEYLAGWQRARADLINLQQGLSRDRAAARAHAREEIFASLLPLADNFQSIINHVPEAVAGHSWTQGVLHVSRQLDKIMRDFGVTVIGVDGQAFDPTIHEAVAQEEKSGTKSGLVIEVIQSGYSIGDKVLRPAKVKVAR